MRGLLLGLLLLAAPAAADEPGLPPAAAVDLALDSHPMVEAARARIAAAEGDARARAAGPHDFIANASVMRRSVDREGDYAEFDASLLRAVRLPGKARLDRRAGADGIRAARNMAEDARHQTAVLLSNHWWDWLGAAAEVGVLKRASATLETAMSAARQRVRARDAAPVEADQAATALGMARAAEQAAVGRERAARTALGAQFPGLPLPVAPPDLPAPKLPDQGVSVLAALVVQRSHEIGAAVATADRMQALAERARREKTADPSVGIRGFSERGGAERGIGVLFSMPFGGGYRSGLADQAGAEASAALADVAAVRADIAALAANDEAMALSTFHGWEEAARASTAAAAAARRMADGAALGGIDLADRLYAERQALDAALAEATARTTALRAITRLRIDSHTLWMDAGHDEH
jgi:outer membrane protein TolC